MSNSIGCIQLQYRKCAVLACVCSNCEQFTSWMLMKKRPNLNVVCIVTHGADTRSIIARHDPIITDIITDNNQFLRCLGRATQRCRARSLHYSARQRWGLASVLELAILTMIMQCWKCQHENHNAFLSFNIPSGIEFQETEVLWVGAGGSVSCGVAADKGRPRTLLPSTVPRSFLWTLNMASEISDQWLAPLTNNTTSKSHSRLGWISL